MSKDFNSPLQIDKSGNDESSEIQIDIAGEDSENEIEIQNSVESYTDMQDMEDVVARFEVLLEDKENKIDSLRKENA